MVERPTWQDEVLRQKERLAADLPSRQVGMAMTCILFGFFLPFWLVFLVYLLNIGSEAVQHRLLEKFQEHPTGQRVFLIIAISVFGFANYSLPVLLVWAQNDTMLKFMAVVALVGALLNISVVRSAHRAFGIFSGIPPALVLLWMPVSIILSGANTGSAIVATIGVVVLLGYFMSVLMQNYRAQTELVETVRLAEASNQAKSRFLSAMSHEIRTPLNAILGYSQIMREGSSSMAPGEYASAIEGAARALRTIIEDVLDLASVAEGQIRFNPVTAAFRQAIEAAASVVMNDRPDAGVAVTTNIASDVPEIARFDPLLLRKCVGHLSAQVLAAMPENPVRSLTINCAVKEGEPGWLRLTIGSGETVTIPASDCDEVDEGPDAAGLTLTLIHRIAGALGARAMLLTTPAGDTKAQLDLPFIAIADPPAAGVDSVYGRLRALVVDDIATNRFVIGQLLRSFRIDLAEADSGLEALEWLKAEPFDLVLLDMNMPGVDGVATFEAIRNSGQAWANIPVIAITADGLADQRMNYLKLGINGYVTKPVDKRLLWAEILSVVPPPPPL